MILKVCNDELTHLYKGKTVMTHAERCESLRHCKWVDEVLENAPWTIDQSFLELHSVFIHYIQFILMRKIDFVAHDAIPYDSAGSNDIYAFVKDQNKFISTKRTPSISTSDLITRIIRDYSGYSFRTIIILTH